MTLGSTPIRDQQTVAMGELQEDISQLESKIDVNAESLITDIEAKIDGYDDDEGLYKFIHDERLVDVSYIKETIERLVEALGDLSTAVSVYKNQNQGEAPM